MTAEPMPTAPSIRSAAGPAIREMKPGDVPAVHRIEVVASLDPWSAQLFAEEFSGSGLGRHWLVATTHDTTTSGTTTGTTVDGAESTDVITGFGGVMLSSDAAHIMNLAVAPDHRRQGIAAALVSRLLLAAGDGGAVTATLEVRVSNAPAMALYRRFGFDASGRRPRYYPDGEDAMIMWAHNIHRPEYRQRLVGRTAPGRNMRGRTAPSRSAPREAAR